VPESGLILIEQRADFAELLRKRFPAAQVQSMDAEEIGSLSPHFETGSAGAVVSGLPLLSMPSEKVSAILSAAFTLLRPDGAFYQFTYALRCPVSRSLLERLGLKAERIGGALLNLPPASVYRISRKAHS
jgi:phospholipid N-methyltransferase